MKRVAIFLGTLAICVAAIFGIGYMDWRQDELRKQKEFEMEQIISDSLYDRTHLYPTRVRIDLVAEEGYVEHGGFVYTVLLNKVGDDYVWKIVLPEDDGR